MTCQRLTDEDRDALTSLLADEPLVANYATHAAEVLRSSDHQVWGCWDDGALVAAVIVAVGPFDVEVDSLIVARAYRRRGLGQVLIEQAVAQARASGKERVLLEVREGNTAAIALYQRMGFSVDGLRANYYPALNGEGAREAACLMSLALG